METPRLGLVMTAGGARAAYQAGVLKRLGELPLARDGRLPFTVLTGASSGALNCAALATGADDFPACTRWMAELWRRLRVHDVFRTDLGTVGRNVLRWMRVLSLGGLLGTGGALALLDSSPLRALLERRLRLDRIARHLHSGHLQAVAVAATDYATGRTVHFVQGAPGHAGWARASRVTVSTPLTVEHLCASAAIPVVFPPVALDTPAGTSYFGDGCLRLPAPLGPAIRLGADRILAIGVRHIPTREDPVPDTEPPWASAPPSLSQLLGMSLSTIFLSHLESDAEHVRRINNLVTSGAADDGMRRVETLVLSPGVHLGHLAEEHFHRMPAVIRYLMGGLGVKSSANADLISYLLFDSAFTEALLEAGYRDACARHDEIEDFLCGTPIQ